MLSFQDGMKSGKDDRAIGATYATPDASLGPDYIQGYYVGFYEEELRPRRPRSDERERGKDKCEACGSRERAMIFRGERWCSDNCRRIVQERDANPILTLDGGLGIDERTEHERACAALNVNTDDLVCRRCGRDNRNGTHTALEGMHLNHEFIPVLPETYVAEDAARHGGS